MVHEPTHEETPVVEISLPRVPLGLVLDIGGGGEGLVSRIAHRRVCVIDCSLSKLREARIYGAGSEWFACDGREICFKSEAFDVATLWFSLAYIPETEHKIQVLREAHRVLKPEARISILGMNVDGRSESFTFRAGFILPREPASRMSYRVKGSQHQTLESIVDILEETGFTGISSQEYEHWFVLDASRH